MRSKLALLSVRRKGIQISLGILACTVLVVVFTALVYTSFNRIDDALQRDIGALPSSTDASTSAMEATQQTLWGARTYS